MFPARPAGPAQSLRRTRGAHPRREARRLPLFGMTKALARWLGRLAATAMTALFITFLVREGVGDLRELTDQELGEFGAVFVMVVGTLVAWRRDLAGALLLLAGYGAFAWLERGWPPLPFAAYPLAAALLLLSAALRWYRRRHPATPAGDPAADAGAPRPPLATPPA